MEKTTEKALEVGKTPEILHAVLTNQKSIAEGMMMLAGVMQMLIDDEISLIIEEKKEKDGGN